MMEEEFYASLKFKSGEEVFSKVSVCDDEEEILLLLLHPIVISSVKSREGTVGFKIEPWLKTSSDDTFIVRMDDILTISESNNIDMIMAYESYTRQIDKSKSNYSKIDRKMGYIGSIDEAKELLEKIFKDT